MIIRRTPEKRIKIVHSPSGEVFDLKVLNVGNDLVRIKTDYESTQYYAQANLFEIDSNWPEATILRRNGSIYLRHASGDEMSIQAIRVDGKDVDFRLHDPNRQFDFLWSDKRLT